MMSRKFMLQGLIIIVVLFILFTIVHIYQRVQETFNMYIVMKSMHGVPGYGFGAYRVMQSSPSGANDTDSNSPSSTDNCRVQVQGPSPSPTTSMFGPASVPAPSTSPPTAPPVASPTRSPNRSPGQAQGPGARGPGQSECGDVPPAGKPGC